MMRTSLSITIVAMTTQLKNGEFNWNEELQGIILSAFFWGYITPMFISGWLANRYGGKILFMSGLGIDGILALILPLAARSHVGLLIACRVAMGLAEVSTGVMVPSFHQMLGAWSPPDERSRMSSFSYAGQPFGIVLVLPLAGLLCEYGLDGGWPTVYYTLGLTALIICCLWFYLVYDTPSHHPRISQKEKLYIQTSLGVKDKKAKNGLLSSLPYLFYLINAYICGIIGDWIIKNKYFSVTVTRKFFQVLASGVPAVCLLAVTFSGCDSTLTIVWLVLAGGFFGAMYTALGVNHVDLSPNFSGILQGITLTIGNLAGILVPYVIGVIIQGQQRSRSSWDLAYYISASVLLLSTLIYVLFGSGEEQPWNQPDLDENEAISVENVTKV
uniref:Major facilitator superfamily (MFS) profile domain-containing protein n=1 Tax=Strigamia maritima TaxID=126957 RepID=T1JB41_STRMM